MRRKKIIHNSPSPLRRLSPSPKKNGRSRSRRRRSSRFRSRNLRSGVSDASRPTIKKKRALRRRNRRSRSRNYGGVRPKNILQKRIQADRESENLLRLAELAVQQQQMEEAARRTRELRERIEREQLLADLREIYNYDFDTVFSLPGV